MYNECTYYHNNSRKSPFVAKSLVMSHCPAEVDFDEHRNFKYLS